jgi:hypothetical protein
MRSNLKNSTAIASFAVFSAPKEGAEESTYDANAIKAMYKEATGNVLPIKNDLLIQLLDQHPEFDDMESELQLKFLTNLSESAKGVAVADPAISELISKIDTTAEKYILETIDRIVRSKSSAMDALATFRRIYTKDEMAGFAFPGLEKSKMAKGDNRKPDIVVTTLKNGDEIKTVWTNDFCSAWKPCKVWEDDIADLQKEQKSSGSVARFKNWGKQDIVNALKIAKAQRDAFRSMVKRSVTFEHQITAIEGMPKVVYEFAKIGKNDNVSKHILLPIKYGLGDKLKPEDCIKLSLSPSPVWLYPKGEAGGMKPYSVTQINNMDIAAAIAAGGEMSNLTDTIAKGPDNDDNDDTDGADADIGEAYDFTVKTANWFARRENIAAMRKILNDPKHEDHKDWLQLVGDIYTAIAPTFRRNRVAYEALGNADATSQDEADEKKTGTND